MKHIELEVPIEDMEEADLRATFAEVMEAHESNVTEHEELTQKLDDAAEFEQQVEDLNEQISEFRAYFAQKGSEVTGISEEILAERFDPSELVEFAQKYDEEQAAEFVSEAEEAEATEEEAEVEESESVFTEKPSKAPNFSEPSETRMDAARERLAGIAGISLDE